MKTTIRLSVMILTAAFLLAWQSSALADGRNHHHHLKSVTVITIGEKGTHHIHYRHGGHYRDRERRYYRHADKWRSGPYRGGFHYRENRWNAAREYREWERERDERLERWRDQRWKYNRNHVRHSPVYRYRAYCN